jgi:hypothetical protein
MNVIDELKKLGVTPYVLSRDEFEAHYRNLYGVLAHYETDLYWVAKDVVLMHQLRQEQREENQMYPNEYHELEEFAKKLALALADEVTYHGEENCSELSLELLAKAREKLNLSEKFEEIDSLVRATIEKATK